jgi:hypothetical protein
MTEGATTVTTTYAPITATTVNTAVTPRARLRRAGSRDVRAPKTNKAGRYVETREYISAARRFLRRAGERVGEMDMAELPALAGLVDDATAALDTAVMRLHDQGASWGEIGRALGYPPETARQAAWQRFGVRGAARQGRRTTPVI